MKELLEKLTNEPTFEDLRLWRVVPLNGAQTVVRLSHEEHDYVAKLAKPNEVEVHRRLLKLDLQNIVTSRFPNLLDHGVLVTSFVPGGPIREPFLSQGLVIDLARVQNRLDPDPVVSQEDRVTWRDYAIDAMQMGQLKLGRTRKSGTVLELTTIVRALQPRWREIATEYASMPFAWLHYDLREANILAGLPQTVIDWGSSHGPGPFLYDMARFCLSDGATFHTFSGVSDLCRRASDKELSRWLYAAACANLATMLKYLEVYENDLGRLLPFYQTLMPG